MEHFAEGNGQARNGVAVPALDGTDRGATGKESESLDGAVETVAFPPQYLGTYRTLVNVRLGSASRFVRSRRLDSFSPSGDRSSGHATAGLCSVSSSLQVCWGSSTAPPAGEEILALLRGSISERGVALIMVTHSRAAARIAEWVIVLRDGRRHASLMAAWR